MSAEIEFLPLGALIHSFKVGGIDIAQSWPTTEDYVKYNSPFFGETIGRVANRLAGAKIDSLNGKSYSLPANDGPNTLHGGPVGFGKRTWAVKSVAKKTEFPGLKLEKGGETVEYTLTSEDGDQGFPGELAIKVIYTTGKSIVNGKEATTLVFEYEAELVKGAEETAINMTNHSYWNISGKPTIEGTTVQLSTPHYLPTDDTGIPTGAPEVFPKVATTKPFVLGPVEPDIDNCFVVDAKADPNAVPIDTRSRPLLSVFTASHPNTKIHFETLTTEPAFQFYTGKYIDTPAVQGQTARGARAAFAVEPSRFVNAINRPEWKNQMLLKKGQKYGARNVFRAWQE